MLIHKVKQVIVGLSAILFIAFIVPTLSMGSSPVDLDGDGQVCISDYQLLITDLDEQATGPDDPRDIDGDGVITVLDARKLILLCDQPRCECSQDPQNQAPTANAGPDRTLTLAPGQSEIAVTLDGSGSNDADGTIISYVWSGLPDPDNVVQPTVNLKPGTYTFTLVVTDDDGESSDPNSVVLSVYAAATSGDTPEYDTVGYDDTNYFSQSIVYYQIVTQNKQALEADSDFNQSVQNNWYGIRNMYERFHTNAGQLRPDPCYNIPAAFTDPWNQGTYEWWIVLQMKPESDINLQIMDCVLMHDGTSLYEDADQTGRYRMPWGELMFNAAWNPLVYAEAFPGPYATAGFALPTTLDARVLPGLVTVPLDGVTYTARAHWPEEIVIAAPKTGNINGSGQIEYNLKQGDIIHVTVEIPSSANTVGLWYGPDSVILQYIGTINTGFFASKSPAP